MVNWVRLCAIPAGLLLASCDNKSVIVAWPGMTAAEFNKLNASEARLREDDTDWIGVNSPVTLIFRQGNESIEFAETCSGGGMQIASFRHLDDGSIGGPARIGTIALNIGEPMEDIAAQRNAIATHCAKLARMIGAVPQRVADVATISLAVRKDGDSLSGAQLCHGRNGRTTFSIFASHSSGHWQYGGDFSRASFHGYLGRVLPSQERGTTKPPAVENPSTAEKPLAADAMPSGGRVFIPVS